MRAAEVAANTYKPEKSEAIRDILLKKGLSGTPLEASGICYLPDISYFVVVSDETDDKTPILFLMDKNGYIERKVVVRGLSAINDMEGITVVDDGFLYVLASQSVNRKGRLPPERKILARIRREGFRFELTSSVPLRDLLLNAALEKGSGEWGEFISMGVRENSIDIEGIAIYRDMMLLGFKNPKMRNYAVILAIRDPSMMFESGKLSRDQVSVWRKIMLYDSATGTFCGISDLCVNGDMIAGLSTGVLSQSGVDEDVGLIWEYFPSSDSLRILRRFTGIKPEGISEDGSRNQYYVVFDNGSKNPSQFMIVKVSP